MNSWPDTSSRLMQRLADPDDSDAWLEFERCYQAAIYRYVRSRGLQPSDARDVVQEVMLVVHRQAATWQSTGRKGAFRAWFSETARRTSLHHVRLRARAGKKPGPTQSVTPGPLQSLLGASNQANKSNSSSDALTDKDQAIETSVRELMSLHRSATEEAQRTEIESDIRALLKEQFTARQAIRALEITRLEEQIKKLRGVLDERNKQGDRIADDHLQYLLRNSQGLGWGGEPAKGNDSSDSLDAYRTVLDRYRKEYKSTDLPPAKK